MFEEHAYSETLQWVLRQAIQGLPPVDLAKFRRWFAEFDAKAWDAQIEADAAAGKLDALAAEAKAGKNPIARAKSFHQRSACAIANAIQRSSAQR